MTYHLRPYDPYRPEDLAALYEICLRTGDNGRDATALYQDPYLLGHYFAAPYATLEPELCVVLAETGTERPVGYVLGTRDTAVFADQTEQTWFPSLRHRYPLPDPNDTSPEAELIRLLHAGHRLDEADVPLVAQYPAHLHIDLLPEAQGQGWGRRLIEAFVARLRAVHVTAVHLWVSRQNPGAVAFYRRVGFHELLSAPQAIMFGRHI